MTSPTRHWTVLVSGPTGSGKTQLVDALARALGRPVLRVHLARLGSLPDAARLELVAAQARFHEAVLHLAWPDDAPLAAAALELLRTADPGLTVIEATRSSSIPPWVAARLDFAVELGEPDVHDRVELWEAALPAECRLAADVEVRDLALQYEITGGRIATAAAWAWQRARAQGQDQVSQADLASAARGQVGSKLGSAMKRVKSHLTLADLVLDEPTMSRVLELRDACRSRSQVLHQWGFGDRLGSGRGIAALLHGKPGTGKTLCSRILAAELDLELLVVSVPDVVSKWVGEGGQIKNALLRAAYRASARNRAIGMTDLEDAARDEAKAAGKLIRLAASPTSHR